MSGCENYMENISALVDGELSADKADALRAHLETCPDCARLYDIMSGISGELSGLEVAPPPELLSGVMEAVSPLTNSHRPSADGEESGKAGSSRRFAFGRFTALAACFAVILLAAVRFGPALRPAGSGDPMSQNAQAAPTYAPAAEAPGTARDEYFEYDTGAADGAEGGYGESSAESERAAAPEEAPALEAELYGIAEDTAEFSGNFTASLKTMIAAEIYSSERGETLTVTDAKTLESLAAILAWSEDGDENGNVPSGEPQFLITVTTDTGGSCTVSVWAVDGELRCASDSGGAYYVAKGGVDELTALSLGK